jgi:hypothetical protein
MDSAFFLNLYCLLYNQWHEICWVPEPGDAVAVDEIVAQIETDKVCDTGLYVLQCWVLSALWLPPNDLHVLQRYLDFFCRTTVSIGRLLLGFGQLSCGSRSTDSSLMLVNPLCSKGAFDSLCQVTIDVRSPVAGRIESVLISYLLGDYLCVDLFEYVI